MTLPGYRYLGKQRGERYLDPEGREISKRQYRNIQLKEEGWRSLAEKERVSRSPRFKEFRKRAADASDIPESELSSHRSDFAQTYAAYMRNPNDRSPDSPLARLLVAMGLRDSDADYDVGDTPKGNGK